MIKDNTGSIFLAENRQVIKRAKRAKRAYFDHFIREIAEDRNRVQ